MSWSTVAIAGGAVIGGALSYLGSSKQAGAAGDATAAQLQMFGTTQRNLQPFMTAGAGALPQITEGTQPGGALMPKSYTPYDMNTFQNSPEYQLMLQQNQNALGASQNASSLRGGSNSNNMKSLMDWTQGNTLSGYQSGLGDYIKQFLTGNQATEQQFGTLSSVAGMGQNAAANLGGMSTKVGENIGSNITDAGNANAAGYVGVGNALNSGIGQGYNSWMQNQYLNKYNNSNYWSSPNTAGE